MCNEWLRKAIRSSYKFGCLTFQFVCWTPFLFLFSFLVRFSHRLCHNEPIVRPRPFLILILRVWLMVLRTPNLVLSLMQAANHHISGWENQFEVIFALYHSRSRSWNIFIVPHAIFDWCFTISKLNSINKISAGEKKSYLKLLCTLVQVLGSQRWRKKSSSFVTFTLIRSYDRPPRRARRPLEKLWVSLSRASVFEQLKAILEVEPDTPVNKVSPVW